MSLSAAGVAWPGDSLVPKVARPNDNSAPTVRSRLRTTVRPPGAMGSMTKIIKKDDRAWQRLTGYLGYQRSRPGPVGIAFALPSFWFQRHHVCNASVRWNSFWRMGAR